MKYLFIVFLFLSVQIPKAHALDAIDLAQSAQAWSMRWSGYRTYRVEVPLKSQKRCILSLSAHVNPRVKNYTLLLHGFGDSRFSWWKWIRLYKDHPSFTGFIALDWPQHGGSNCDEVIEMEEVVEAIVGTLKKFDRPIDRIVAQSLGVVPASLLVKTYPEAQQVWLTPPLLDSKNQKKLRSEILSIENTAQVQVFMYKVLTDKRDFPNFILKNILERIKKGQRIVAQLDSSVIAEHVFKSKFPKLLVIGAAKDTLTPPQHLDERIASLAAFPIQYLPCGHDVLRKCGEDVRQLVEQSRYDIRKAEY